MVKFKEIFFIVLRAAISIILLFFLFRFKNIDVHTLFKDIGYANKPLLWLAFLITFFNYVFCFWRWDMLLRAVKIFLPIKRVIISFCGGIFFNLFLPSSIGGDLARSIDLARHTQKTKEVVATVLLDRLSGYVGLAIVVLISVFLGWNLVEDNPVIQISLAVIILTLVFILLALFNKFLHAKINALLNFGEAGRFRQAISALLQEMHYFRKEKKVLFGNIFLSVLIQAIGPLAFYITALSLGSSNINGVYFFVLVPIVGAVTMLPISMGGFGVREGMTVFLFLKTGMDEKSCLAMSLLNSCFLLIYGVIGGLIYVFTLHHRRLQPYQTPAL